MNIPRNYEGNIVYDTIPANSIVTTSDNNLSSIQFDKGILVNNAEKDNNVPSFQSYNGILYYNNGILTSTNKLSSNQLINTDINGNLSMTTLAQNSIIYTSNDSSIRQLKFERDQLFYVGSNGNLMNYDMKDNKILYIQDSTLNSVDITSNKNLLLYVDNQQEFPTLSTVPLESNSILYTNEDEYAKINQLKLYPNQIISTDGSKNLQGYNLSANSIIYIDNDKKINFIQKNNGILNTYNFAGNTVSPTNPHFTNKIVLNNCEIVTDSGRIIDNYYLIYGKPYNIINGEDGGLSNINIPKAKESSYEYYYIVNADVNAGENAVNVSSASQIYTNLYNEQVKIGQNNTDNTIFFNAIPICTSASNEIGTIMNLNVLVPKAYQQGDYYINSSGDKFSLKLFSNGSIKPSQLNTQNSTFNYKKQDILTVGTDQQVFNQIPRSTATLDKPYLSGDGWADLKKVNFLNSNNCSVTDNMNYAGPLVVGTSGLINKVNLGTNKYVLTKNSFSQLTVDGNDLRTVTTSDLNLKNILQITDDKSTITTLDNVVTSGIFHTDIQGNITFTQLKAGDIPNNTITNDKIKDSTITGSKLDFEDSLDSSSWSNIIIDSRNNLIKNQNTVVNTNTKYGVLDYHGNIELLTANLISEGTMSGARIENRTITSNHLTANSVTGSKLDFEDSFNSSAWSNIIIDSRNNNLIKRNNTVVDNSYKYGVINNNGEIKSLTANLITSGTFNINVIPDLNASKITSGTFDSNRIAVGAITGEKLSLNTSTLSGNWNNILLDNGNLIKTDANFTNYGVFTPYGNVTTLDAQVLNSVGLKFFTPKTDEGKIDESSYFATKFTVYSSNSGNIDYNCSYYTFANYNSITSFSKKILCNYSLDQNKNLYNNSINNTLSNTYKLFYEVIYKNKIDKYIKINTSIYINSVTFTNTDLIDNYVNNNNLQFTINNLKNNNLKLIVGVYTNLYNNNDKAKYYDIMYVNNNIYQLLKDITGGINDMLLGYVIVDTKNLVADYNNDIYTATINKQYDFESYININSSFKNFDYSPQNILTFRPLYYINESNNTSSLFYYNTSSQEVNDFIDNFTYTSIDYYNIVGASNYVNVVDCKIGNIDLPNGSVYIDKTNNTLAFAKRYDFVYENNKIIFNRNNEIFTCDKNTYDDNTSTIITEDADYIYMHLFINKPFESNLKFNIKPITTYTHIKYNKSSSSYVLTNPEFIFSLFNFTLTVTDYVGEYPSIIQ